MKDVVEPTCKQDQTENTFLNFRPQRYELCWAGKREALQKVQEPVEDILEFLPEMSVTPHMPGDIFIEGENLQVLKLLQNDYQGKVKLIYIEIIIPSLIQSRGIIKKCAFAV